MTRTQALKILGLDSSADGESIKKAYKKLALKHHPDKNKGSKESEEKFKEISAAYDFLTKPQTPDSGAYSGGASFFDMEQMLHEFMFGPKEHRQKSQPKRKAPPLNPISFGALNLGRVKFPFTPLLLQHEIPLSFKIKVACVACLNNMDNWQSCHHCQETGFIVQNVKTLLGQLQSRANCNVCRGVGWIKKASCRKCKDQLVFIEERTIKFILPKKFILGGALKLPRAGHEGWLVHKEDIILEPVFDFPDTSSLTPEEKEQLAILLAKSQ